MPSETTDMQPAPWPLRFEPGEREARKAAGEWLGTNLANAARTMAHEKPETIAISDGMQALTQHDGAGYGGEHRLEG